MIAQRIVELDNTRYVIVRYADDTVKVFDVAEDQEIDAIPELRRINETYGVSTWNVSMTMNYWPQFYFNFFARNKDRIVKILDSHSCRELWIQGEMYLDDVDHIRLTSSDFHLVDIHGLSSAHHPEMVTEMKVIGFRGYSREDILGFGGRTLLEKVLTQPCVQYDLREIKGYPEKLRHSIFKDYLKLKKIEITRKSKRIYQGEKYFLLVIPYKESAKGSQGRCVDAVMKKALEEIILSSGPNHWTREYSCPEGEKAFAVRLWRIIDD